jgi:hypothetical protein
MDSNNEPFLGWPIGAGATIGTLRRFLTENNFSFQENVGDAYVPYHLLVEEHCLVLCSFYNEGKLLPTDNRLLTMLQFIPKVKDFPPFVTKKGVTDFDPQKRNAAKPH